MSTKTVLFFTDEYPYGEGEVFIENEFPFLQQAFDKIIIIHNAKPGTGNRLNSGNKTETLHYPYDLTLKDKFISLKGIFTKEFWTEIRIIKLRYPTGIDFLTIKTLLSSIQKKKKLADFLKNLIAKNNLDTTQLWAYSYWLNDMAIGIAELKKQNPSIKAFSRAHGWDVYMNRHKGNYLPLRWFLLQNLDIVFAISEHGKQYLQNLFPEHTNKIKLARLGTFNNYDITSKTRKANTNVPFTIVSCSNIIPLKRLHLLIEALSLLSDSTIHWIHFGSGVLENEIKALAAQKLRNMDNIQVEFKGRVSNKDLMNFYVTTPVHLFVNVSETEGLPVSIMEAMSFGIPCIATDVGGTAEIVNKQNGLLLSSTPSAALIADAIKSVAVLSDEKYLQLCLNAHEIWRNNYKSEKNYSDFLDVIIGD